MFALSAVLLSKSILDGTLTRELLLGFQVCPLTEFPGHFVVQVCQQQALIEQTFCSTVLLATKQINSKHKQDGYCHIP